jgi:hypothetical protein
MPALPSPDALLAHALEPRTFAGLAGVALVLVGARVYRVAVMAPGFAAGVWAGTTWLPAGLDPLLRLGAALLLGLIGAGLCSWIEQLAVRSTGAILMGALTHAVAPQLWHGHIPMWVSPVGALVGAMLFPMVYRRLLPLITSLTGALCVAWALGRPQDLLWIAGLTLLGLILQLGTGGGAGATAPKRAKGKGKDK